MNLKKSGRKIVMLGVVACLLLALSGTTGISAAADSVLYAKPSASGSGNCSDWDNACTLQTALGAATAGEEIWVAAGTHKPTDGIDRTATFQLKIGVGVYGGFAGTETSREERDWTVHETILGGDIGEIGDDSDNSYHVVTGSGTDGTSVLNGFTITGGYADGSYPDSRGGGMFNVGGSPTLINVTFSGNSAGAGSGMWNFSYSSPTLTNVIFSGNSSLWGPGGGMWNWSYSSPTLTNVTFSGNWATDGGGMYNTDSSPTLTNVTFSGNSADNGGGMFNYASSPTLTNVTFRGNSGGGGGGGMRNSLNSSATLTNVIFSGNVARFGGGMYNYWDSSPTLTNVTFSGNSASEKGGGMFNIWNSSPTLTNSILWGNTALVGAEIYNYNDSSTPTIKYSLVEGSGGSGPEWDTSLGTDAGGNIDADPQFVDAANGDLHLQPTSPAIDVGDNGALPADTLDLDGDGDTVEPLPLDLDGNPRIVNGIVDMGAYEVQTASVVNECVQALPDLAFANPAIAPQMRNALENKLLDDPNSVFNLIEGGMIQDAIDKLKYDIRAKADGSLGGNPANDWITDPTAQAELADMIDALVAYLETLL